MEGAARYLSNMPAVTLRAHYDGKRILLDEPFDLPANSPLMVTVLPPSNGGEKMEWSQVAAAALGRAYSEDEPEYSAADIKS